jgi:hypothetical protein
VQVDALIARVERTAVVVCVLMALAALMLTRGRLMPALAVLGGGLLASVSYRMIVAGAGALAGSIGSSGGAGGVQPPSESGAAGPSSGRPSPVLTGAKVAGRYALLGLLAYVMIARLRLPPLGLLAGASSVVAAVSVEAVRFLLKKTP